MGKLSKGLGLKALAVFTVFSNFLIAEENERTFDQYTEQIKTIEKKSQKAKKREKAELWDWENDRDEDSSYEVDGNVISILDKLEKKKHQEIREREELKQKVEEEVVLEDKPKKVPPKDYLSSRPMRRSYGRLSVLGLGGLFSQPEFRGARILSHAEQRFSLGFHLANSTKDDLNSVYTSEADLEMRSADLSYAFGIGTFFELGFRTSISELQGALSLITNNNPQNLIRNTKSSPGLDDIEVDALIKVGEGETSWMSEVFRYLQNPLLKSASSEQALMLSVKAPTGKEERYTSSGRPDFRIGMLSSWNNLRHSDWSLDVNYYYTIVGNLDSDVFKDQLDEENFFTAAMAFNYQFKPYAFLYTGVEYQTKQIDGPFDIYENDGLRLRIGGIWQINKGVVHYNHRLNLVLRDSDRYAMQFETSLRF